LVQAQDLSAYFTHRGSQSIWPGSAAAVATSVSKACFSTLVLEPPQFDTQLGLAPFDQEIWKDRFEERRGHPVHDLQAMQGLRTWILRSRDEARPAKGFVQEVNRLRLDLLERHPFLVNGPCLYLPDSHRACVEPDADAAV